MASRSANEVRANFYPRLCLLNHSPGVAQVKGVGARFPRRLLADLIRFVDQAAYGEAAVSVVSTGIAKIPRDEWIWQQGPIRGAIVTTGVLNRRTARFDFRRTTLNDWENWRV
jgi:hypothetical protein